MVDALAAPVAEPAAPRVEHHRPALDGIRALAVGGVITYHLGSTWLPGGFLGVDLFFVLSGFLITRILLAQIEHTGRISFSRFYTRRARRLLPALYLLILGVCLWAAFIAQPDVIGDLRGAALAALFYVANWFFILTGQSYFAAQIGPSPLEHTWSLAIEEQYYLVWPLILLLLARRFTARVLMWTTIALIAVSVAVMAWWYDAGDPSTAYFGTLSRLHELLIGSLIAIGVSHGLTLVRRRRWTAWIAVALILAFFLTVQDTGAFYYRGGSVLFCLIVGWLILALGSGKPGGGPTALFAWKPIAWVGLISYGLYLWHWPLILWLNPTSTGLTGPLLALVRLGATFAIATASYYLIERPIRRGALGPWELTPRRLAVIVPVTMAVMAGIIIASTVRAAPAAPIANLETTTAPTSVTGAAAATAPTVAIAGDSVPTEAMSFLEAEAKKRGWNVLPLSYGGCSITGDFQTDGEGQPFTFSKRCSEDLKTIQSNAILQFDPEVVVWYSNRERYPVIVDDMLLYWNSREHQANLDASLDQAYQRFTAKGAKLVIVMPVPKAPPVKGTCLAGEEQSSDCAMDQTYYSSFTELRRAYEKLKAKHPKDIDLVYVDDLLCPDLVACPLLMQDGVAVRPDGIHFSDEGAHWFVPMLFDRMGIKPLGSPS